MFRYEVVETDPDNPTLNERHVLEAIDVKREKTVLTRDKCRYLLKLATEYDEKAGYWRIKVRSRHLWKQISLLSCYLMNDNDDNLLYRMMLPRH